MKKSFEAFAGYGSQFMAIKELELDYENAGISEVDKYAIIAYNAVHGKDCIIPDWSFEKKRDWLVSKNIGFDFKKNKNTLKDSEVEPLFTACVRCKNHGDISLVNPKSLGEIDLFTYSFPCFLAGTLIMTDCGFKNIEDIVAGDNVLTHTNTFQSVVKPMVNKADHIYKVSSMGSEDLFSTEEHPFYVRKKNRVWNNENRTYVRCFDVPEWVKVKDLSKDYYTGIAINQNSKLPKYIGCRNNMWGHNRQQNKLKAYFSREDFWWFVGRYIGDGWTQNFPVKDKYRTILCCSKDEASEIESVLSSLGFNYSKVEERTVFKYHICDKELSLYLDRFGKYAYGKKLNNDIFDLPINLLKSFCVGYLSADGCINKNNNMLKITSISRELIYGMGQCVAKAYNRPFSIYKTQTPNTCIIEGRIVNQRDTYTISWKPNFAKQDQAFYEDGYIWSPIRCIEKQVYDGVVYNMEVENDNSYTVNNIIVHNCQDISLAGKQKGLEKDGDTRSGLLWECKKIVEYCKPRILLMENVKNLVGKKFKPDFDKWCTELEELGYENHWQVMNAKDYGIPQNRERVFMVSILGGGRYTFPEREPLELRLKDVLEDEVGEKYYLKPEQYANLIQDLKDKDIKVAVREATKRGYAIAKEGDSINLEQPNSKTRRGRVGKGVANTLTTSCNQGTLTTSSMGTGGGNTTCIKVIGNYSPSGHNASRVLDPSGISPTVMENHGTQPAVIQQIGMLDIKGNEQVRRVYSSDGISPTSNTMQGGNRQPKIIDNTMGFDLEPREYDKHSPCLRSGRSGLKVLEDYAIRKLTPLECFRLMGVTDEDFFKIKKALNETFYKGADRSSSQLYKLAGNSIVVNKMVKIFHNLKL